MIKIISNYIIILVFLLNTIIPFSYAQAQSAPVLPSVGSIVSISASVTPALIQGLTLDLNNPFVFDFIVTPGSDPLEGKELEAVSHKMIKYFLAAMTTPEDEMWVNLSPYEQNRIIPAGFSKTQMGHDLLAQDYLLKQLTASLMNPASETGVRFWDEISHKSGHQIKAEELFNKVWIVPEHAVVYEEGTTAVIVESRLKVLTDVDYISNIKHPGQDLIKEYILPVIEKEVNEGASFANLRQITNAVILATWFKNKVKTSLLTSVYVDQAKTGGIDDVAADAVEKIYAQYVASFKQGIVGAIKEEYDPATQEVIHRKYFTGGARQDWTKDTQVNLSMLSKEKALEVIQHSYRVQTEIQAISRVEQDQALLAATWSEVEFEDQWKNYVSENDLAQYDALLKMMPRSVKEALLDDASLRPVFLQKLKGDSVGELKIEDYNAEAVQEKIGGKTLLQYMEELSGFLVGSKEMANKLAGQGMELIVGVTDAPSDLTMYDLLKVANGRQAYFPLPDHTWLGVKGAGQFINEDKLPHELIIDEENPYNSRYLGIVSAEDVQRTVNAYAHLKATDAELIEFLGYRSLAKLPDGKGELQLTGGILDQDDRRISPVLIFNRVLTPHRLVKIPQLMQGDPELKKLRHKLSLALFNTGKKKTKEALSLRELMVRFFKVRGKTEAIKLNNQWFKFTIHAQDLTLAAEESDNEEFLTHAQYKAHILENDDRYMENNVLLFNQGLGIAGIRRMISIIYEMESTLPAKEMASLIPNCEEIYKELFQSYFKNLNNKFLKIWSIVDYKGDQAVPLPAVTWHLPSFTYDQHGAVVYSKKQLGNFILKLAQAEMNSRLSQMDEEDSASLMSLESNLKDRGFDQTISLLEKLDDFDKALHFYDREGSRLAFSTVFALNKEGEDFYWDGIDAVVDQAMVAKGSKDKKLGDKYRLQIAAFLKKRDADVSRGLEDIGYKKYLQETTDDDAKKRLRVNIVFAAKNGSTKDIEFLKKNMREISLFFTEEELILLHVSLVQSGFDLDLIYDSINHLPISEEKMFQFIPETFERLLIADMVVSDEDVDQRQLMLEHLKLVKANKIERIFEKYEAKIINLTEPILGLEHEGQGLTLFEISALLGNVESLKLLWDYGFFRRGPDHKKNALIIAEKNEDSDMVEFLNTYQAITPKTFEKQKKNSGIPDVIRKKKGVDEKPTVIRRKRKKKTDVLKILSNERKDKAQLTHAADVGGIDLNPAKLELQTEGREIQMSIDSVLLESLSSPDFMGFEPIIINILPLESISDLSSI